MTRAAEAKILRKKAEVRRYDEDILKQLKMLEAYDNALTSDPNSLSDTDKEFMEDILEFLHVTRLLRLKTLSEIAELKNQ